LSTVRDDCDGMSDPDRSKTPAQNAGGRQEVLSSLPRHRPQRLTARRQATRKSSAVAKIAAESKTPASKKSTAATPKKAPRKSTATVRPAAKKPARSIQGPQTVAPKQGFAAEESTNRGSVQPPNGGEMLVSVLHLSGALGKGGVETGGRLLKGLLSRVLNP
jgi:hypothetical protein